MVQMEGKFPVCVTLLWLFIFWGGASSAAVGDPCSLHQTCEMCLSVGCCWYTTTPEGFPTCASPLLELDFEPRVLRRRAFSGEDLGGCPKDSTRTNTGLGGLFGVIQDLPELSLSSASSQKARSPPDSKEGRECSQTGLLLLIVSQFVLILLQMAVVVALWKPTCLQRPSAMSIPEPPSTSSSKATNTPEEVISAPNSA